MSDGFRAVPPAELLALVGKSMPARRFLDLFGVRVRNHDNVARIEVILAEAGLATVPPFGGCASGAELRVVKATPEAVVAEPDGGGDGGVDADELPSSAMPHRALQIGDLPSACDGLVSVRPDSTLAAATLLMTEKNYSQVPVISGGNDLHGVVTWSSIAHRVVTGQQLTLATAMVTVGMPVAEVHQHLLPHLPTLNKHGYLLVRENNGTLCGIITPADVNGRFETMAKPFFLVGDIEARLRKCLAVLDREAVAAVQFKNKKTGRVSDLTFGQYQQLLQQKANWQRIGWPGVPQDLFVTRLDRVRVIRNEIAHFRPEPLSAAALDTLEEFAGLLKQFVP